MKPYNQSDEDFLKILRSNPAGHTTIEIADKLGLNRTTALHRLRRLEKMKKARALPVGRKQLYTRNMNPKTLIWIVPPDPTPRLADAVSRSLNL